MAKAHGRLAHFSITDAGAVERNLSDNCNNIDFPRQVDSVEVTGFGSQDKDYIPGLRSATIKIQGQWDDGANDVDDTLAGLLGGGAAGTIVSTFVYGPKGTTSGLVKNTGSCFLMNYQQTAPVGGVISFSADFQIKGSVTKTTF